MTIDITGEMRHNTARRVKAANLDYLTEHGNDDGFVFWLQDTYGFEILLRDGTPIGTKVVDREKHLAFLLRYY